jgi:hypothetical protein
MLTPRHWVRFDAIHNSFLFGFHEHQFSSIGVRNTDFLIFYDCVNRLDKHCEFYELLEPVNLPCMVIVTFLTPNDRYLTKDFLLMLQRYDQVSCLSNITNH